MADILSTYRMQMQQSINCLSDLCGLRSPSLSPLIGGDRRRGSFGDYRMMSEIFIIPQKKKEPKKKIYRIGLCRLTSWT